MEHQTYGNADGGILREWTANGLNQLTAQTAGPGSGAAFTYDADGNMLGDGTRSYAWDAENRLVAVSGAFGTAAWEYDAFNRRVRQHDTPPDAAEQVRELIWEGLTLIESRAAGEVRKYYGNGEERMPNPATPEDPASSLRLYYTTDHLGSIRELVDSTGLIRARYDYAPYGERTKLSGDLDCDFGYTDHYTHNASGLVLAPYRAYDPALGRWLSQDTIGESGGINLYAYANANPAHLIDISGAAPQKNFFDPVNDKTMYNNANNFTPANSNEFAITGHGSPKSVNNENPAAGAIGSYDAQSLWKSLQSDPDFLKFTKEHPNWYIALYSCHSSSKVWAEHGKIIQQTDEPIANGLANQSGRSVKGSPHMVWYGQVPESSVGATIPFPAPPDPRVNSKIIPLSPSNPSEKWNFQMCQPKTK